ncbi:hypothetical protein [Vannielia litorea]|uniref:Uncharacterized protein n=1 Tax=Vannielia litorea TaxID=1217970 RepID=A0A1N6EHF3_9RHOB|nr:hypothetical protein [Vannielia litorea]SIN82357.1 hypothetical protein SAMN05444002_0776 [Vannielia litorea]
MPKLVSLYIRHVAIGFLLAAFFVVGLLALNVGNLWHLVTHTSAGPLAVFLLFMFNGIVFSGVQFGIAVMRMAEPEDGGQGGRRQAAVAQHAPVPVRIDPTEAQQRRGFDDFA